MRLPVLDIEPSVFQWARAQNGYSLEQLAQKLNKSTATIQQWENTGEKVPFADLEKLATLYKMQVTVFFLSDTPPPIKKPKDKRNFRASYGGLTPKTMLAIRRTHRYLQIARELNSRRKLEKEYTWLDEVKIKQSSNATTKRLLDMTSRLFIEGFSRKKVFRLTGRDFKFWRNAFEEILHIYVFQFLMPKNELDGFSYTEEGIPFGIVINKDTSEHRKTFTLFHELGHILYRESGLCVIKNDYMISHTDIERQCNRFAAEFLMPSNKVESVQSYGDLGDAAEKLKVSKDAYLWRLKHLEMIDQEDLEKYLMRVHQDYKEYLERKEQEKKTAKEQGKDQGFAIPSRNISKSQRGQRFFNLVSDAYYSGKMSASEAADLLQIRPTKL